MTNHKYGYRRELPQLRPIILVAEDESLIRLVISDFLNDAGFEVIQASTGDAALKVIETRRVDLVFSDINMPGDMKGDSLAEWLSTHHPTVPVIMTSGREIPDIRAADRRFIRKPYALSDVEHQIRELLH
jgi:DNA-binding response OmpR family regulator